MNKLKLSKIVNKIFIKHGLNKFHSKMCTDALINAELVEAHSHGLSRIKMYCERIKKRLINPIPVFFAFSITFFIPIFAATKPMLLSASI